MASQDYVYTSHATNVTQNEIGDLESVIGEYARQGWRLCETLSEDGTTVGLVFEREV